MGRRGRRSLSLYRKGAMFWVSGWDPSSGCTRHRSTGETVPALARVAFAQLAQAWQAGEDIWPERRGAKPAGARGTLAGDLAAYKAWRAPQVSPHTLANDMSRLRAFCAAVEPSTTRSLTRRQVQEYTDRSARQHAKRTYNQVVLALRVFFRWAVTRRLRQDNPAEGIRLLAPGREAIEHLTLAQRDKIIRASAGSPLEPAVLLALGCGLRLGEIERLAWRDLDLGRGQVLVRRAKGGRPRTIPIPRPIAARLAELQPEVRRGPVPVTGSLTLKSARAQLAQLGRQAGCRVGWNLFRHTFGSLLAQKGVSLYKIGTWLGHQDPRTTVAHYAALAPGYDADVEL
jgi:integrase